MGCEAHWLKAPHPLVLACIPLCSPNPWAVGDWGEDNGTQLTVLSWDRDDGATPVFGRLTSVTIDASTFRPRSIWYQIRFEWPMPLTLKELCTPRASAGSMAETVAEITDLGKLDGKRFFDETHVTEGMATLLRQVFQRLTGESDQGVYRLKQAMGGGKTHNLLAAAPARPRSRHAQGRPRGLAWRRQPPDPRVRRSPGARPTCASTSG